MRASIIKSVIQNYFALIYLSLQRPEPPYELLLAMANGHSRGAEPPPLHSIMNYRLE